MDNYEKQATDFLKEMGASFEAQYLRRDSMPWDEEGDRRDIYKCTIKRGSRKYSTEFGQSIVKSGTKREKPTAYDFLACITTYDPGTFSDFCGEFGYDEDSRKAEKIYKGVLEEYMGVCALFNGAELEKLQEIQ